MTTKTLDRSRNFGTVYGSSDGGLYYQDGCTFNGDGKQVGAGAPATIPDKPGPNEVLLGSTEADATETGVTLEQLKELHPAQIKKLVVMAELPLETGVGSKKRNIENLLAAG